MSFFLEVLNGPSGLSAAAAAALASHFPMHGGPGLPLPIVPMVSHPAVMSAGLASPAAASLAAAAAAAQQQALHNNNNNSNNNHNSSRDKDNDSD